MVPPIVEGELTRRRRARQRRCVRIAAVAAAVEAVLAFLGGRASAAVSAHERASTAPPASSSSAVRRWRAGAFARCVRARESSNGRASRNLYGMLDGWIVAGGDGDAAEASIAEQDYRAWRLWRRYGDSPWRPYDGCVDRGLA
jgi:hypothetical protein